MTGSSLPSLAAAVRSVEYFSRALYEPSASGLVTFAPPRTPGTALRREAAVTPFFSKISADWFGLLAAMPISRCSVETEKEEQQLTGEERDMTIGEIYDMHEELAELEKNAVEAEPTEDIREDLQTEEEEYKEELQEVPESDQEEEKSAEPEVSYTEDYAQPVEEEAEPYEEAEVTSY